MTKTQTAPTATPLPELAKLTRDQLLILRDTIHMAEATVINIIEADLAAQGINLATYTGTDHPRNEEYLELSDVMADLNEALDAKF